MDKDIDKDKEIDADISRNKYVDMSEKLDLCSEGVSRERFSAVGIATAIYALLVGVCLYKNLSGIMTPILSIGTVIYVCYCMPRMEQVNDNSAMVMQQETLFNRLISRRDIFYYIGIIILGISICLTSDEIIIFADYAAMIILVFSVMLRSFCDDGTWGFKKYGSVLIDVMLSPLVYCDRGFRDFRAYRKAAEKKNHTILKYIIIGVAISLPFLAIIIVLLASADFVFFIMVDKIFSPIHVSWNPIGFIILVAAVFIYTYGIMVKLSSGNINEKVVDKRNSEPVIGITFTSLITFVYLVFSIIQIMYIFAGDMMLPEGYTYSSYARQGFYQLLFVAFLNLVLVLAVLSFFKKSTVLNVILTVMCGCTYIMIASSAIRMLMYIWEYNLTYRRVLTLFALLLIAVVMAGVIAKIYRENFHLIHYTLLTVGALYIVFSFCRPQQIIAKYNVDVMKQHIQEDIDNAIANGDEFAILTHDYSSDIYYLKKLGADAAPALYDLYVYLDSDGRSDYCMLDFRGRLEDYFLSVLNDYKEESTVRGFNFSEYKAYNLAKKMF